MPTRDIEIEEGATLRSHQVCDVTEPAWVSGTCLARRTTQLADRNNRQRLREGVRGSCIANCARMLQSADVYMGLPGGSCAWSQSPNPLQESLAIAREHML